MAFLICQILMHNIQGTARQYLSKCCLFPVDSCIVLKITYVAVIKYVPELCSICTEVEVELQSRCLNKLLNMFNISGVLLLCYHCVFFFEKYYYSSHFLNLSVNIGGRIVISLLYGLCLCKKQRPSMRTSCLPTSYLLFFL